MPIDIDGLRLVAALSHSVDDADVELTGPAGRMIVSYRRADATIDPCAFRQLVIATRHGHRMPWGPIEVARFVGQMRELGGGITEHRGPDRIERHIATLLPAARIPALLADLPTWPGDVRIGVRRDDELGTSVVVLTSSHPVVDHRIDAAALAIAARCMVDELVGAALTGRAS